jgi:hypothetical protein
MEEIKLWELKEDINKNFIAEELTSIKKAETEKQLEELLVKMPDMLMPGMKLIGRQTSTEGGPLDLLGIDENGYLVVFELKRGTLTREAVAQVLDYASYIAEMDALSLSEHISKSSGNGGIEKIEDFNNWYSEYFPEDPDRYAEPPKMVLIGLGVDDRTKRMVNFLADRDINISLITFQAFVRDGKTFLAKRVEVEDKGPISGIQQRSTKTENLKSLKALAEKMGVAELLDSMSTFFRGKFQGLAQNEFFNKNSYSYSLREKTDSGAPSYRVYLGLYLDERKPGIVNLIFQERAREAAEDSFNRLCDEPQSKFTRATNAWYAIGAQIRKENWNAIMEQLNPVIDQMISGWSEKMRENKIEP